MALYREVFEALARENVQYLVAGGFAVNFHQVQRATVDLDLVVHLESTNLKKFLKSLKDLGYQPRLPVDPALFADEKTRSEWIKNKNLKVFSFVHTSRRFEVIDVFSEEPAPFDELFSRRLELAAFGTTIPVVGKNDLIQMKRLAARDKDLFDIQQLEKK